MRPADVARVRRRFLRWTAAFLALAALACLATNRPRDAALYPAAAGAFGSRVYFLDHGYHASLVVARNDLADIARAGGLGAVTAVADKFRDYDYLEIGWGDEGFYRGAAEFDLAGSQAALRALFGPANPSALHIVGLTRPPDEVFTRSHVRPIDLSVRGAEHLARFIAATFAVQPSGLPEELGPGLYGPSLFYRAAPAYSLSHTCNHWVAEGLNAAGLGVSMFPATLSAGLRADLALREWAGW